MWQVLLAAAVAGSTGLVAKHFLGHERSKQEEQQYPSQAPIDFVFGSPENSNVSNECGYESNLELLPEGIFRFSSSGSLSSRKKTRILKKKSGIKGKKLKFEDENDKAYKRSVGSEGSARRFAVCLKKRKTAKTVPANRGSSSSKDSSLFGWGLGLGIMYMMSAGKAEISKLSTAMDETSKVVQELRTELYKRKSPPGAASSKDISNKNNQLALYRSGTGDTEPKDIKGSGIPLIDDVECPSSVLTEEPEPQVLEMDQLEAELASELQKLPWSNIEASGHEGVEPAMGKNEVLSGGFHELEGQSIVSNQCNGVLPSELDQKLCHLLIEQQENQIEVLESELHSAQSKLNEKEGELQALKDCVRRLTEFSLSNVSDDETEVQVEQQCTSEWDNNTKMGSESRKSVVGMKRPIHDSA